jgi:hypothetical protein
MIKHIKDAQIIVYIEFISTLLDAVMRLGSYTIIDRLEGRDRFL